MLNRKLIESEFSFLGEDIFLNVSSVVMPPIRVQKAYESFMQDYIANYGDDIVPKAWDMVSDTRKKVAQLIHAVDSQEHQANLFPWINLHQRKNVDLHVVKSRDGEINADDMIAAIDENTKILTVSAVQFSTGFFADLHKLGAACREKNVIFMVDGIQALGRLDIDVQAMNIDWLAAGTNKGLLGTLGAGIVYCTNRIVKDIIPPYASYQSVISHVAPPAITTNFDFLEWHPNARRFESGNLSYNCINAINKGIELILELGIKNIDEYVRQLEMYLRKQLEDLDLHVVQAEDKKNWGGVVCVYYPSHADEEVISILRRHKIHCTMRGGYIRLGIDFYNTQEQMDKVSAALHEVDRINR